MSNATVLFECTSEAWANQGKLYTFKNRQSGVFVTEHFPSYSLFM